MADFVPRPILRYAKRDRFYKGLNKYYFGLIRCESDMPRQDTKLESEGAEFLVLGHLLIHRIQSYKAYTNMPGYDLVAINPEHNTSARIQVKSRWRTGAPGFTIKSFNCDFVVVVKLNRGNKSGSGKILAPECLVFPTPVLEKVPRTEGWHKMSFKNIPDIDKYHEAWQVIRAFLSPGTKKL